MPPFVKGQPFPRWGYSVRYCKTNPRYITRDGVRHKIPSQKFYPDLRIRGLFAREAGFEPGDTHVIHNPSPGVLVITKVQPKR